MGTMLSRESPGGIIPPPRRHSPPSITPSPSKRGRHTATSIKLLDDLRSYAVREIGDDRFQTLSESAKPVVVYTQLLILVGSFHSLAPSPPPDAPLTRTSRSLVRSPGHCDLWGGYPIPYTLDV